MFTRFLEIYVIFVKIKTSNSHSNLTSTTKYTADVLTARPVILINKTNPCPFLSAGQFYVFSKIKKILYVYVKYLVKKAMFSSSF